MQLLKKLEDAVLVLHVEADPIVGKRDMIKTSAVLLDHFRMNIQLRFFIRVVKFDSVTDNTTYGLVNMRSPRNDFWQW